MVLVFCLIYLPPTRHYWVLLLDYSFIDFIFSCIGLFQPRAHFSQR
jgi:hypothetical protein